MARTYASVYLTIWNDPDFRDLPMSSQWLYFAMLTHPTLTSCGVMEWREPKIIRMTEGLTVKDLREAAWQLGQRNLIAIDPDTEEALVRSFVRHDGGLKSPNLTKAMVREHGAIASKMLMALVSREVRRAIDEHPDYRGVPFAEPIAKQFPEPFQFGSGKGSDLVPIWFHSGSANPSDLVPPTNPSDLVTPPEGEPFRFGSSPSPSPSPSPNGERVTSADADPGAGRKKPKRPIPDDWTPQPRHREKAGELHLDLDRQVDLFKSNAQMNDRRVSDWDKAFTNWLTKAVEYAARDGLLRPTGTTAAPTGYHPQATEADVMW